MIGLLALLLVVGSAPHAYAAAEQTCPNAITAFDPNGVLSPTRFAEG